MSYEILTKIRKEVRLNNVREIVQDNLSMFKYKNQLVHGGDWNDINTKCRGLVFDTSKGRIICRPFEKFFNINERPSTKIELLDKKLSDGFRATEKLDGSLINLYNYDNVWKANTTGTFDNIQSQVAIRLLLTRYDLTKLPQDVTICCELISPLDRECKVLDYGDKEELFILAAFENSWIEKEIPLERLKYFSQLSGMPMVPEWVFTSDIFSTRLPDDKEGYVIRFNDGQRVKVKSFHYVRKHRLISLINVPNVIEYIKMGQIEAAVEQLPQNYREQFDDVYSTIMTEKRKIETEVNLVWSQVEDPKNYKKCAELFTKYSDLQSILFARMREKDEQEPLWKLVEERLKGNADESQK